MDDVKVTLVFKDKADRDRFMVGLSDGFGESYCSLEWPHETGLKFDDCETFKVNVF